MEFPLGAERSIVSANFKAIPYATDMFNAGNGALDTVLWDHAAPPTFSD